MKRMFQKEIAPRLPGGNQVIQRARLNCFGVGESKAEEMLGDLTARGRDPEIGITVHEATITLRIVTHGKSADECRTKIDAAKIAIRERMGEQVFGEEDETLEHVVVRMTNDLGLPPRPPKSARAVYSPAASPKSPTKIPATAAA